MCHVAVHVGMVLAGGLSTRMGRDKAQLQFQGKSLLENAKYCLANSECEQVLVSHNHGLGIADRIACSGPLGGIDAVINTLNTPCWLSIVPVDMPRLCSPTLAQLQRYAVLLNRPVYFDSSHLPCVLYVDDALKQRVSNVLNHDGPRSIKSLLGWCKAQPIATPNFMSHQFINANTPAQWSALVKGEHHGSLITH